MYCSKECQRADEQCEAVHDLSALDDAKADKVLSPIWWRDAHFPLRFGVGDRVEVLDLDDQLVPAKVVEMWVNTDDKNCEDGRLWAYKLQTLNSDENHSPKGGLRLVAFDTPDVIRLPGAGDVRGGGVSPSVTKLELVRLITMQTTNNEATDILGRVLVSPLELIDLSPQLRGALPKSFASPLEMIVACSIGAGADVCATRPLPLPKLSELTAYPLLALAVLSRSVRAVEQLLAAGANVDDVVTDRRSLKRDLTIGVDLTKPRTSSTSETAPMADHKGWHGWTPLMLAAKYGLVRIAKLLLAAGASAQATAGIIMLTDRELGKDDPSCVHGGASLPPLTTNPKKARRALKARNALITRNALIAERREVPLDACVVALLGGHKELATVLAQSTARRERAAKAVRENERNLAAAEIDAADEKVTEHLEGIAREEQNEFVLGGFHGYSLGMLDQIISHHDEAITIINETHGTAFPAGAQTKVGGEARVMRVRLAAAAEDEELSEAMKECAPLTRCRELMSRKPVEISAREGPLFVCTRQLASTPDAKADLLIGMRMLKRAMQAHSGGVDPKSATLADACELKVQLETVYAMWDDEDLRVAEDEVQRRERVIAEEEERRLAAEAEEEERRLDAEADEEERRLDAEADEEEGEEQEHQNKVEAAASAKAVLHHVAKEATEEERRRVFVEMVERVEEDELNEMLKYAELKKAHAAGLLPLMQADEIDDAHLANLAQLRKIHADVKEAQEEATRASAKVKEREEREKREVEGCGKLEEAELRRSVKEMTDENRRRILEECEEERQAQLKAAKRAEAEEEQRRIAEEVEEEERQAREELEERLAEMKAAGYASSYMASVQMLAHGNANFVKGGESESEDNEDDDEENEEEAAVEEDRLSVVSGDGTLPAMDDAQPPIENETAVSSRPWSPASIPPPTPPTPSPEVVPSSPPTTPNSLFKVSPDAVEEVLTAIAGVRLEARLEIKACDDVSVTLTLVRIVGAEPAAATKLQALARGLVARNKTRALKIREEIQPLVKKMYERVKEQAAVAALPAAVGEAIVVSEAAPEALPGYKRLPAHKGKRPCGLKPSRKSQKSQVRASVCYAARAALENANDGARLNPNAPVFVPTPMSPSKICANKAASQTTSPSSFTFSEAALRAQERTSARNLPLHTPPRMPRKTMNISPPAESMTLRSESMVKPTITKQTVESPTVEPPTIEKEPTLTHASTSPSAKAPTTPLTEPRTLRERRKLRRTPLASFLPDYVERRNLRRTPLDSFFPDYVKSAEDGEDAQKPIEGFMAGPV